jgi:hypothetical protein
VDRNALDEFLDEDASLLVARVVPDAVEVEVGIAKHGSGPLEGLDERFALTFGFHPLGVIGGECVDLGAVELTRFR